MGIQAQQATSPNNLRQRVQLLNRFFEAQGIDATLSSRKDGYWLTFDERLLAVYADAAQEAFLRRSKDFDDHGYSPPQTYPEPRVFVSHKWYGNKRMNKVVDAFIAELRRQLSHPLEDRPSIRLFFDRGGFNKSEPYLPQQDQACAVAQIGLILWHLDYQDSKDCLRECEFFITAAGDNQPGKRAIVVLAYDRLADCPRRFTQRIVHCDPKHGALQQVWEIASETQKADYVRALRDEIYQAWDLLTAPDPSAHQDDQALLRAARAQRFADIHGREAPPQAYPEARHRQRGDSDGRIQLLDALVQWAGSDHDKNPRVTALLGDFGYGKTVSCQMFAKRLAEDHERDAQNPLPLYLDLRKLQAQLNQHLDQPVAYLLQAMLQDTGQALDLSGQQVIEIIRRRRCVVIVDGFDEVGQRLDEAQQQQLYHRLLDIIPQHVYRQDARRLADQPVAADAQTFNSRLLISCRTHFFNRLDKEREFLSGNNRHALGADGVGVANLQRFYMAPFEPAAIRHFLCSVLGEDEGARAYRLLGSIHDLSELSAHPIMLSLISRHIPDLAAMSQRGQTVNSASLYWRIFDAIGQRDLEKHVIRLSDKQQLLAALALDWWRQRRTGMSIKQLDAWFAEYAGAHPVLKNQLVARTDAMTRLMQDLCNASLLVRDGDNHYRFAHTSYLEFFRALGIFEAIRVGAVHTLGALTGEHAAFDRETARFLINWRNACETEERQAFDQGFSRLLAQGGAVAGKRWGFQLWRFGQEQGGARQRFAHNPAADWSELTFTDSFIPPALASLDFSQANLSRCQFHLVTFADLKLRQANFCGARLLQCYVHRCDLAASQWAQARLEKTDFFPEPPPALAIDRRPAPPVALRAVIERRHVGPITSVAFSPDGERLASASRDKTIKIWDARQARLMHTLEGHGEEVTAVAFSPSGERIASASWDTTVKIWDAQQAKLMHTLEGHEGPVTAVAFSPDGNTIVSVSSDGAVKLWDAATGRGIKTLQHLRQGFIAYSGDVQAPALLHASGDAWRYLQALTDQGEVMPISRHSDWGTVYTP